MDIHDEGPDSEGAITFDEVPGEGSKHAREAGMTSQIQPFQYICIERPLWDEPEGDDWFLFGNDNLDGSESVIPMRPGSNIHGRPIEEHPDWKWPILRQSWDMVEDWRRRTTYCEPDLFGMYVYNDFFAYGLQELQENALVRFDDEFRKETGSIENLWAIMAGMMHWQLSERCNWLPHDDGQRASETFGLVGCAFLTLLGEVKQAGLLKPDSELRDLDIVMCMALEWTRDQEKYGIHADDLDWREYVVAYAKQGKITLSRSPLSSADELVRDVKKSRRRVGNSKTSRWKWRQKFDSFARTYGTRSQDGRMTIGGHAYDITRMSREERALLSFDRKDPLLDIPEDIIQQGGIVMTTQ